MFSLSVKPCYYFIYREFVTNEATTTWKNFYEEHNKTLESSGNDSEVNPHRPSVGHLGKRIFDQQFQEVDANDLLTPDDGVRNVDNSMNNENLFRQFDVLESVNDQGAPARHRKFELSSFTNNQSQIFADEFTVSGFGEVSDRISANFTNVQLLGRKDDLEDIEKDLKRQTDAGNMVYSKAFGAADVSEYIEIDLNMTHIAARNDESDMSITDTIHSSEVNVSEIPNLKSLSAIDCKNWVVNKENIAINPYVTPKESTNFAVNEEPDKILVFDGKRLTIQTELEEKVSRTSVTENTSRKSKTSLKKPIVLNIDDDLPNFIDNPQAFVSHILPNDSHSKDQSMVIGDETVNISVSEANVILDSLERRRTILYGSNAGDISVTQAVPPNIILPETIPSSTDKNKTVIFENEDITPTVSNVFKHSLCNVPSTQAFSLNVIEKLDGSKILKDSMTKPMPSNVTLQEYVSSEAKNKVIVSTSDTENMSMTHVVPENLILQGNTVPEHRKTNVLESDIDISMTQAVLGNVILLEDQDAMPKNRKTNVFKSEDENMSMTDAVPMSDIISVIEFPETCGKRKTIVFESDPDISMTQAVPRNIILCGNQEKRKTIVFDSEDADISITQAIPTNIIVPVESEKRKTTVNESDNDISMTQAIPASVIFNVSEKRTTIVYESDNDVSMTQAVPKSIIIIKNGENVPEKPITMALESIAADESMKQLIPSNLIPDNAKWQDISMSADPVKLEENKKNNDHSKSEDISVAQAAKLDTVVNNQNISEKSSLNCNNIEAEIPTNDNANAFKCDLDASEVKSNTNVPKRKSIVGEPVVDVTITTQSLPVNSQLFPEKLITPNDNGSSTSLSPSCKLIADKRQSHEMTITEFNNTDKVIEEPQVTIHTEPKLNKMFRTEKITNLSLTKPIPADLLTIQKILDKSNISQLLSIGEEKKPINQNFIVYQTNTDMTVIPPLNTEADAVLKEPFAKDLSRTDLQHNKGQIELFRTENNQPLSLKDMTNSVSDSYHVSKSPSNKSKISNNTSEPMPLVSDTASQNTKFSAEGSTFPLRQEKPIPDVSDSSFYQSRLLSETSSQQFKDGNTTQNSKKSLLVDLLDMSCASITSGLEDKSATAKIESDNSVNEKIEPNSCGNIERAKTAEKSIESLFYITSGSDDEKSEEHKKIRSKDVPLPLSIQNNGMSEGKCFKNRVMQYIERMNKVKDKMPSNRVLEKIISPDKDSNMSEQLLEMLDSFTDVEEQTNPLDEINTAEDQNKFLSLATASPAAGHSSNKKSCKKSKPVTPRTSTLRGSSGSRLSSPNVRSPACLGSPVKRRHKQESPLPSHGSPRKSPNAGHRLSPHSRSAIRQSSPPRMEKEHTLSKKDLVMEKESQPTSNELHKYKGVSNNELVGKGIEEVRELDEHISGNDQNEDRKIYLINDEKQLYVEDSTEIIENKTLCDKINKIMNEQDLSKETLISKNMLYSSNDIDVPEEKREDGLVSEPLNVMDEEDISCVLKEAAKLKELLYPMKDNNIKDENNVCTDTKDGNKVCPDVNNACTQVENRPLSIENKNIEDTSTLPGLTARPPISVACSLESLVSKRQSSINPRRQSVVFSKEDLMNNISLAQAILQKELEETVIDEDEESRKSINTEKKMRIHNEVVKSLRFEDDEIEMDSGSIFDLSINKNNTSSSPLKKTAFGETSYMNDLKSSYKVNVIPSYLKDVSNEMKRLMNDLMKPDADADVLPFADTTIKKNKGLRKVPSTRNSQAQADLFTSSQIDLQKEPMSTVVSQQSSTTTSQREIVKKSSNKSVTVAIDKCPLEKAPEILVFDPGNPLNNIYIKPADFANAHRYEPLHPDDSPVRRSRNTSNDNSIEEMFTQYNVSVVRSPFRGTEVNQNYKQKRPEEKMLLIHDLTSQNITNVSTLQSLAEIDSADICYTAVSAPKTTSRDAEMNTLIAMRDNLKILQADSSLTLVNEAGDNEAKTDVSVHSYPLNRPAQISEVEIIYDRDLDVVPNDQNVEQINNTSGSKRKYSTSGNYHKLCTVSSLDITPKPAKKIAKRSVSPDGILNYSTKTEICQQLASPSRSKNVNTSSHRSPAKHVQIDSCPKSTKDQNNKSPNSKTNTKDESKSPSSRTKQARKPPSPKDNSKRQKSTTICRLAVKGMFSNKPYTQQIDPYAEVETMEYIRKQKVEYYVNEVSTSSSKSEVTRSDSFSTSCGKCTGVTMDWQPELMHELSSKNLVTECESDINVVQMIDALPFMG